MTAATETAAPTVAQWRAIGTYVHLAVRDPEVLGDARALAEELLDDVDRTCSRFRADSDLTRANAAAGRWVDVDPLLAIAAEAAINAARATGGLVDPCLGRQIVSLGYDCTFGRLAERQPDEWTPEFESPRAWAWEELAVDANGRLRVPSGVSLDLGATAKAWASDLIATSIHEELGVSALISLGGDIAIAQDEETAWPVRVTERPDDTEGQTVFLHGGGLATSSTQARRWSSRGGEMHHLLDPRTGRPVDGPWRTVTASGSSALAANTATTASLVLGDAAVDWLARFGVSARLVGRDGRILAVGGWPADEGDAS